ncbi:FtsQ-type POTRA domain-containing protein [Altererythrobacter sp. H2]|uniref:cell division protein FtsQ/DivIB n=1 Tax=Altererythrobacter sp. H2 TaxID=3108391 RepID=UPI002B4C1FE7|nr:FtsQ-type POTRA domain-containing protein [Altererythrobacter sp. H2]WRK95335.1 FtsQ-type POTRA domain-containing protein [Altererythrobacter sp. H2]
MAKVTRKAPAARRVAAANGRRQVARRAQARTGSFLGSVLAVLPFTQEQLERAFLAIVLALAATLAWFVASMAGVPALARHQLGVVAANAGLEVRRVRVTGVERMNELKVYERALAQRDQPMPFVDLQGVRQDLLGLSWVKDARVSRQLPDTLVIDIVERVPHAVLKKPDRLVLIDDQGVELEPVSKANAKGMLIVEGPGAAMQIPALGQLLDSAPALRPQVAGAEWIGNRRWNLTFKTGQIIALPQGDDPAAGALVAFARLDGQNRLIGGKVARFDMRVPDRVIMRVPGRAEEQLQAKEAN